MSTIRTAVLTTVGVAVAIPSLVLISMIVSGIVDLLGLTPTGMIFTGFVGLFFLALLSILIGRKVGLLRFGK